MGVAILAGLPLTHPIGGIAGSQIGRRRLDGFSERLRVELHLRRGEEGALP